MMNTQTVILDVDKRYDPSQVVTIGQGDKSGTTIVAEVYDKGVSVSLNGYTAEFEMRLPDGRNYVRDDDCTVSGNTITYVVDEEHCGAAAGHTNECYFNIKYGSSVIYSTSRFRMDVLRAAHDGAVPSESWDSAIEEAIENANEAAEEAREAAGGTVPLMSATQRGGAKLGAGLALTGEALGVDPLTTTEIDTVASDGSLTSSKALTGTMLTYLWSKIKAKFASLVNGAVAISQGGTGATTAALARTNLDAAQSNGASGTLKAAEDGIDALEASFAYVESTTATANHAVGDYFMLGNVLMRATAAIAAGETINASKATPATVQGQIDTLRDSVDKWYDVSAQTAVTPSTGFSVKSDGSFRYSGIQKMLDCAVFSSKAQTGGTIGELTKNARPRSSWAFFAFAGSNVVYVTFYSSGKIIMDTRGITIPANTNIWLRTLYV